jgi:hypothetical protein
MKQAKKSATLNIKSMRKQELENLKIKLFEKIYRDISNKYSKLLYDKDYNLDKFEKHFKREIENSFDFNNPDYLDFFKKVESVFLKEMNKIDDKKRDSLLDKETVTKIVTQNEMKSQSQLNQDENIITRQELIKKLKQKENDEWALITKYENMKFIEDNKKKVEDEEKRKKEILQDLHDQIILKKYIDNLIKNEEDSKIKDLINFDSKQVEQQKLKELEKSNEIKEKITSIFSENSQLIEIKKKRELKEKEDEKKAKLVFNKQLEEEDKKHKNELLVKHKREYDFKEFLKKQIKDKEEYNKAFQANLNLTEQQELEKKVQEIMEKKEKEKMKLKYGQQKYKEDLDFQIYRKTDEIGMTEQEKKINKILLDKSKEYLLKTKMENNIYQ